MVKIIQTLRLTLSLSETGLLFNEEVKTPPKEGNTEIRIKRLTKFQPPRHALSEKGLLFNEEVKTPQKKATGLGFLETVLNSFYMRTVYIRSYQNKRKDRVAPGVRSGSNPL